MPLPAEVTQAVQDPGDVLLGAVGALPQRPDQTAQFIAGVRVQAGEYVAQLHTRLHPVLGDGGSGAELLALAVGDVEVTLADE